MSLKFRNGTKHTSQLAVQIDGATDGAAQSSENWALFMSICDTINSTEDGPKEAAKAIRKRLGSKHPATITLTLKLVETCVKNCGKRFHVFIATKDFMQDLIKVISPKYNPSVELQNTVLGLIQTWAHAFQTSPDLREVWKHYQELKSKGVEFPPLDPDQASQAHIPEKSAPPVAVTDVQMPRAGKTTTMSPTGQPVVYHAPHAPPGVVLQPPLPPADRVTKLRTELATVQQNCRVFGEMLTELASGNENASDVELLGDLNMTCRQMQKRIVELIETAQIDQITEELLGVNDELNNVFLRYDRYQRLRAGRAPSQPTQDIVTPPYPVEPPVYSTIAAASGEAEHPVLPPQAPVRQSRKAEALHQPPAGVGATQQPATNDVAVAQLIDLDGDTSSTGATSAMAGLSVSGGAAMGGIDQPPAYQHQADPFQPNDKESDIAEMEKWLLANPKESAGNVQGGEPSVTSSEFDQFLAERARDVEHLPNVGGTTSSPGHRADSSSVGQTSNQPGSELFSL